MSETENDWTRLERHVAARVRQLQDGYVTNSSAAVSELARLRRGVAIPLGRDVELIELTRLADLSSDDGWLSERPTDLERAAYTAIVFYALHQQSHRGARMHRAGYSFGRSARLLGRRTGTRDAVRRRFNAIGTAQSWDETVQHARGLIQQFRGEGIPLDYARFARDLLSLRIPGAADRVRLAWARDFYRTSHPDDDGTEAADAEPADATTE